MAGAVEQLLPVDKRIQLKHRGLVVLIAKGEVVGMKACKVEVEAKSGEQKRQERTAIHTATHEAAVIQAVRILDHNVSSLTTGQMEAIAFVHLGCPAVRPLGSGNKKQIQKEFAKHRSASTWNGNNKRAVDLAGGDAGDAKRHKAFPPR